MTTENKNKMNLIKVDDHLKEKLKNPYFRELYELEKQKFQLVKPIIAYRIKHGITQGQLAKKVGVSQQHISKIENGDFTSVVTLEKVLLFVGYKVKIKAIPLDGRTRNRILRAKKAVTQAA